MNTKMKMRMLSLLLCFVMLVGLMPTSVFAAGTISSVTLNGGTAPTVGATPDFSTWNVADSANYTLDSVTWYNRTDDAQMSESDTFKAGKTYYLTATFKPKSGYSFANTNAMYATLDGIDYHSTEFYTAFGGTGLSVYYVFIMPSANSYSVSFDANGGSGTMTPVNVPSNSTYYLPDCTFTPPSGKEFWKWDQGKIGDSIFISSDTELKAIWRDSTQGKTEITSVILSGGSKPISGETVDTTWDIPNNAKYTISGTPTWYNVSDGTSMGVSDVFEGGKKYRLSVTLYPKDDAFFADKDEMTATLENIDGYTTTIYHAGGAEAPNRSIEFEFVKTQYAVTFETNGGSSIDKLYTDGGQTQGPENPTKNGYTFAGWYEDKNLTQEFNFNTMGIWQDYTLYAKWVVETIDPVNLTFSKPVAGQTPNSTVTDNSDKYSASMQWTSDANGNTPFNGQFVAGTTYYATFFVIAESPYEFAEGTTVYINETPYTATWVAQGHTTSIQVKNIPFTVAAPVVIDTINIIGITTPTEGAQPTVSGITTDTPGINLGTIQWNKNGSVLNPANGDTFETGTEYTLYLGYSVQSGYKLANNVTITSNLNYDRKYVAPSWIGLYYTIPAAQPTEYIVSYNANGGSGTMVGDMVEENGKFTLENCTYIAPEGYKFKAWAIGSVNGEQKQPGEQITITAETYIYAIWEAVEYNVTVTGGTASVGAGTPITKATMGTTVTLTAGAAPSGQMFDKWVVNGVVVADANSATTTFVMPAGNVTAEATYKNIPVVTYTVSFDANGGTGSMADATGVSGDYVLPVCGFTAPNGKQFKAWSVGGVEKAAGDTITVNANTTVTAIWENIPVVTYTVSFAANGGTGTMADVTGISGEYTLPANGFTAPAGKQFKAWSVGGVEKAVGDKITVTANTIVTAIWEDIPVVTYTVSFAANGGTGTMADVTGISGEYTLPANGFTAPDGKQFKAWSVGGIEKAVGAAITVTANTTVTAVWEDIPVTTYTITFNANGGSVTPTTATTAADGKLTSLPTPTRSGSYSFKGWYTAASSGTQVTIDTVFNADTTIYAQWTYTGGGGGGGVSKYTVKFETNGGSTIANKTVTRNTVLTEPTAPTKDGYTFDGWYTDKELITAYDFAAKVTKSFTLYAKWTEKEPDKPIEPDNPVEPDSPEWKNPFTDVKEDDWYYEDVEYAVDNGLFNGTSNTTFAPNGIITRAMMVTVLYRAEGEPEITGTTTFEDVDSNAYYAKAVVWGQQNGIIKGYSETEFAPDQNITREQIATIMHRYAQYKGYDVSVGENTNILSYDDFDSISEYAISSMQYAVGSGLMKGKSASTLNPLDNATRAEIAAILRRFIEANK